MSNSVIAAITIPVVVAIALAFWMVLVYRADRSPGGGRPEASDRLVPRRDVAGGTFRGGGRQVMPRRDAVPAEAAGDPAQNGVTPEDAPAGRPDTPAGL